MKHKFKIVRPSKYLDYIQIRCVVCAEVYYWQRDFVHDVVTGRSSILPGDNGDFRFKVCLGRRNDYFKGAECREKKANRK